MHKVSCSSQDNWCLWEENRWRKAVQHQDSLMVVSGFVLCLLVSGLACSLICWVLMCWQLPLSALCMKHKIHLLICHLHCRLRCLVWVLDRLGDSQMLLIGRSGLCHHRWLSSAEAREQEGTGGKQDCRKSDCRRWWKARSWQKAGHFTLR